jgi:hypothetical protein
MNSSFINHLEGLLKNIYSDEGDLNSSNELNTSSSELSLDYKDLPIKPEDIFNSNEDEDEIKTEANSQQTFTSSFQRQMPINRTQTLNEQTSTAHLNMFNRTNRKYSKTHFITNNNFNMFQQPFVPINQPQTNPSSQQAYSSQLQFSARNTNIKKTFNHHQLLNNNNNQLFELTRENKRFNTTTQINNTNSGMFIQQPQQIPFNCLFNENKKQEMEILIEELEYHLNISKSITTNIFFSLKHKFIPLLKNQIGSRLLQNYLPYTNTEIISLIYQELSDKLTFLLPDPYANYFCIKLFQNLSLKERISFLTNISKQIVHLSTNKISTCSIQSLIANINTKKEKELFVKSINKVIKKLAYDSCGAHVLEKVLICFEREYTGNIISFVVENFILLANNVNGLCLAKKILVSEYQSENFLYLKLILQENCLSLIENPYGNYALQVVIESWNEIDLEEVFERILKYSTQLTTMKYSSNVLEKCILKSEFFLNRYVECVVKDIGILIRNGYGNYVIQTAVKFSKGDYKRMLVIAIENNLDCLCERKLISKWKTIIGMNNRFV